VTIGFCNGCLLNVSRLVSNRCCLFAKLAMIRESVMLALSRRAFEYAIKGLLVSRRIHKLWRTQCKFVLWFIEFYCTNILFTVVVIAIFGLFLFHILCIMHICNCWAYSSQNFCRLFSRQSWFNW